MSSSPGRWWHALDHGSVQCDLCPHGCVLQDGSRGRCHVRLNAEGTLRTEAFAQASACCVDPIEKKPLYHFLPGSRTFSFGTIGCNMGCRFCQNASLSRALHASRMAPATPELIVRNAQGHGCDSVAFTYNEPIVSAEFCIEVAQACHEAGLKTVAVTSGFITGPAREAFFEHMDAANIDLKGFSEAFYQRYCKASLAPVLETLAYVAQQSRTWLEVTNLVIPGANDAPGELEALAAWVAQHLGTEVPLHFSAFHPDHHLQDRPPTPLQTLQMARACAQGQGLRFVYLGNVREQGITQCPRCHQPVLVRDGYQIVSASLENGRCRVCGTRLPGVFPSGSLAG